MNKLNPEKRRNIINLLVEGNSMRGTARIAGTAFNTVLKLLSEVGPACEQFQDKALINLPCKRIQCDEIWSFVYSREQNIPAHRVGTFGVGNVWIWVGICAETKIVPTWTIGRRDASTADFFMKDLASRMAGKVQLSTDSMGAYPNAVSNAFGSLVDYAMNVKRPIILVMGNRTEVYSPSSMVVPVIGNPEPRHVHTNFIERQNLTMRMGMRRFSRWSNAFSKKVSNHRWALALYYMHYNFIRIHRTLKVTPAMAAGITDRVWDIEEIFSLKADESYERTKSMEGGDISQFEPVYRERLIEATHGDDIVPCK